MLMTETVQKVKCWILNETTNWNWLDLSSSGMGEPALILYEMWPFYIHEAVFMNVYDQV